MAQRMICSPLTAAVCILFAAYSAGASAPGSPSVSTGVPLAKRAIIFAIDGLGASYIDDPATAFPSLSQTFREGGTYIQWVRSAVPYISIPSWVEVLTSRPPPATGVTSNGPPFVHSDTEHSKKTFPTPGLRFPSLLWQMRKERPEGKIMVLFEHEHLSAYLIDAEDGADATPLGPYAKFFNPWEAPHFVSFACSSLFFRMSAALYKAVCSDVAETVVRAFITHHGLPDIALVHIDVVDSMGHTAGFGSSAYRDAMVFADAYIARVLRITAAESPTFAEETVVVIASDHGGIGDGHGALEYSEVNEGVPLVMWGPGVPAGCTVAGKLDVTLADIAPTVASLLGLGRNPLWMGRNLLPWLRNTCPTGNASSFVLESARNELSLWNDYFSSTRPPGVRPFRWTNPVNTRNGIVVLFALFATVAIAVAALACLLVRRLRRTRASLLWWRVDNCALERVVCVSGQDAALLSENEPPWMDDDEFEAYKKSACFWTFTRRLLARTERRPTLQLQ